ncbi:phasin family protein [Telmatospirillum sp.]|uniref:phasin family protein n=1 Tax=Telmatospirillum sp. TaxID=2079197 RepID=UPI00285133D8|nr:phasin family protein [Telmatospirillum sp.]MDR3437652.1 phasin family protein [Telmatospirillum sp.]
MTSATVEQITTATKSNVEALSKSGSAAIAGIQELASAYQSLATRNVAKLAASIQALATVTSPVEFIALQQKLIKEGVETAVADSSNIANLTTAVFTAAFAPVQGLVDTLQKSVRK